MIRHRSWVLACLSIACEKEKSFEAPIEGDVSPTTLHTTTPGEPEPAGETVWTCWDEDIGSAVPEQWPRSTRDEPDNFPPSCLRVQSPDYTFRWTAPTDGLYLFHLIDYTQPGYRPLLALVDTCGGEDLACSSEVEAGLILLLDAQDAILVFVDAADGSEGEFTLEITAIEEPDTGSVAAQ